MVVGIGIDLIEVARVARTAERHGDRFLRRIYHPNEIEQNRGDRMQYLAARFAVKEALFKALGTGWARGIRWVDVEVQNLASGQPILRLHGEATEQARRLGADRSHVTITHTSVHAAAVVILESVGESAGDPQL